MSTMMWIIFDSYFEYEDNRINNLGEKKNSIFAGNLKNCVGVENELNVITVRYNVIFVLFSKRKSWKNPVFMGVMRAL